MSDSPRKARLPLTAEGKAHQILQSLSLGTGVLLWLAWYFGWPLVGDILPLIGNPILNLMMPMLPANLKSVFENALIAAALSAGVVACSLWLVAARLAQEPLTRWLEEQELQKIETQARRLQAARERLEQKRSNRKG